MDLIYDPQAWMALLTLTAMEIILGIDNVVFISVLVSKLPADQAKRARALGLSMALVFRIILLFFLSWIISLREPVISAFGFALSWRDIILIGGGLFLLYKSVHELHNEFEEHDATAGAVVRNGMASVILQVTLIDLVFSVDSIVTAIGMAQHLEIMIVAVLIAMGVMYISSGPISGFIQRHPTTKVLALAFLLLIGISLVGEGLGMHIPRAYIYFAMAFAAGVETVNVMAKSRRERAKAASAEPK